MLVIFSRLVFVVELPDVNWGNNIYNTYFALQIKVFLSTVLNQFSMKFPIHYHRESSSSLVERLMREFVHFIAV